MNKQKETPSLADINDAAMDCRADYENKSLMPRNIEEAFIKGALWYRNKIQQEIENLKRQLSQANEGIWAGDYKTNKEQEDKRGVATEGASKENDGSIKSTKREDEKENQGN